MHIKFIKLVEGFKFNFRNLTITINKCMITYPSLTQRINMFICIFNSELIKKENMVAP